VAPNVVGYSQEGRASLIFGVPVKRWGRLFTNYSYEVVKLNDVTQDIQGNIARHLGDEPVFDPLFGASPSKAGSRRAWCRSIIPSVRAGTCTRLL
jgi:hypothetical protein